MEVDKYYEIVVAIDPANNPREKISGSIWVNSRLTNKFAFKYETMKDDFFDLFRKLRGRSVIVAVEDQYYLHNFHTAKRLVEIRARIWGWVDGFDYAFISVPPQSWQSAILGVFAQKRAERKRRSLVVAKAILGMKNNELLDHNTADAICIGQFIVNRMQSFQVLNDLP